MSTLDSAHDPSSGAAGGEIEAAGRLRDQAGRQRDTAAARRDDRAADRDDAAGERDRLARHRTKDDDLVESDVRNAQLEVAAQSDRARAYGDRVAAANDRADAATDRQAALADRMAAARDRRQAAVDGLTGAYNREAGLLELGRDVARAARSGRLLIVAFIDVDHLKIINDEQGHAAGDRALITVADVLHTTLRPYDLVIRYGGDEFICAAEGIDLHAARLRFIRVNELLARAGLSVTAGLAKLRTGDTIEQVIARADADLYQQRH